MNPDDTAAAIEQQRSLSLALQRADLSVDELWTRYFGLGGEAGRLEVDAYVHGLAGLPAHQRDILAHTVNERLDELMWMHRASYSRTLRDGKPRNQPLGALVQLLEGTELAPSDRLPIVTAAAGRVLGLGITLYLVDYDQRVLHPVRTGLESGEAAGEPPGLRVDGTLAGRAFREVRMLPAEESLRLWVPLLDGAERLGVLEVEVGNRYDLYDPGLRTQCRWISMLLGHLVTLLGKYSDAADMVRLRGSRTVAGELIWSLLPPLTAGVDSFIVSGVLEPRYDLGGDAFDYALSSERAVLLIVDAVGHDLSSALIAATAIAAYRSARHAGHGLVEQARAIDEAIATQFHEGAFATAVLAEIDLRSGRLRYVNAGHPPPLIMRAGKVVKPLAHGRRLPLGLGAQELRVGEEMLEPEDWLVLHTDGITEARNGSGEFFGEERLTDFLQREAASGNPPPETVRRLVHAVLDHQGGELQDDATVLLARWTSPSEVTP